MSPRRRSSETTERAGRRPERLPGPVSAETVAAALRAEPGLVVLTGGQTGVDSLAARSALAAGLPVHLAFPRGLRQEDGPVTPERLAGLRGAVVHELAGAGFAVRTRTCVGLADAVILVDPAGGDGCSETIRAAADLGRPLLDLTAFAGRPGRPRTGVLATVREFLSRNSPHVVLVAGCRASLLDASGTTAGAAEAVGAAIRAAADLAGPPA
ncbi:MAG TPA: putative molybdenum carrier protein [Streptosporangiaceae bacterium]